MDATHFASGEELFNAKSRNQVLPSWGGKESEVSGSWFEEKQVEARLQDRQDLVSEIRFSRKDQLSLGRWIGESKMVLLIQRSRSFWEYMGVETDIGQCLYPEEALYLIETGELEVTHEGMPLSIQSAQVTMFDTEYHLDQYHVYAHLVRSGCKVVRHQPHLRFTKYEKQIRLDQHQAKKKRNKLKLKDEPSNQKTSKSLASNVELNKTENEVEIIDLENQDMDDALKDFYSAIGDDVSCIPITDKEQSDLVEASSFAKFDDEGSVQEEITSSVCKVLNEYEKKKREYLEMFPSMLGTDFQMIEPEEFDLFPENSKPQKEEYRVSLEFLNYYSKYIDDGKQDYQQKWGQMGNQNRSWGNRGRRQRNNGRQYQHFNNNQTCHRNTGGENFQYHDRSVADVNLHKSISKRDVDNFVSSERRHSNCKANVMEDIEALISIKRDQTYDCTSLSEASSSIARERSPRNWKDDEVERKRSCFRNDDFQRDMHSQQFLEGRKNKGELYHRNRPEMERENTYDRNGGIFSGRYDDMKHARHTDIDSMDIKWDKVFSGIGMSDHSAEQNIDCMQRPDNWDEEKVYHGHRQGIYQNEGIPKGDKRFHNFQEGKEKCATFEDRWHSSKQKGCSSSVNSLERWESHFCDRERFSSFEKESTNARWGPPERSKKSPPHWLQHDDRWSSPHTQNDKESSDSVSKNSEIDLTVKPHWKTRKRKRKGGGYDTYPSYLIKLPKVVNSWKEYKNIVNSMSEDSMLTQGIGQALWKGPTTPLLKPAMATTLGNILTTCSFQSEANQEAEKMSSSSLVLHFDVYLPNAVFKKSSPSIPGKRITVVRDHVVPSLDQIQEVTRRFPDEAPVVCAVVQSGEVRLYALTPLVIQTPKLT